MAGVGTSVLVVDDAPDNLRVTVGLLEAYSFTILTARDGEAGLRRAKLMSPDLILMDVQMPGLDGYETCRRLKADPATASIPVIFMTVLSEPAQKIRGFEAGGVDFVTKPVEAAELLARVRTQVQLRAIQRELEEKNAELERRVAERTATLEQLLALVRAQSDGLRELTRGLIEGQRDRERGMARTVRDHVAERLRLVKLHLEQSAGLAGRPTTEDELRAHLATALELLGPALTDAAGVERQLDAGEATSGAAENPLLRLSTREYEIVQLLAGGKSNKEIADELDLKPSTVSTHRARIMEKLGVTDLASLIRLALVNEERP